MTKETTERISDKLLSAACELSSCSEWNNGDEEIRRIWRMVYDARVEFNAMIAKRLPKKDSTAGLDGEQIDAANNGGISYSDAEGGL